VADRIDRSQIATQLTSREPSASEGMWGEATTGPRPAARVSGVADDLLSADFPRRRPEPGDLRTCTAPGPVARLSITQIVTTRQAPAPRSNAAARVTACAWTAGQGWLNGSVVSGLGQSPLVAGLVPP